MDDGAKFTPDKYEVRHGPNAPAREMAKKPGKKVRVLGLILDLKLLT
jgi:hypothetical protein